MRPDHMSREMVRDFVVDQAHAEGKQIPPVLRISVVSHERIRIISRTVLTTNIDDDEVLYEVIHNTTRKEAYLSVYNRASKNRVSYKSFESKHPEYSIRSYD